MFTFFLLFVPSKEGKKLDFPEKIVYTNSGKREGGLL